MAPTPPPSHSHGAFGDASSAATGSDGSPPSRGRGTPMAAAEDVAPRGAPTALCGNLGGRLARPTRAAGRDLVSGRPLPGAFFARCGVFRLLDRCSPARALFAPPAAMAVALHYPSVGHGHLRHREHARTADGVRPATFARSRFRQRGHAPTPGFAVGEGPVRQRSWATGPRHVRLGICRACPRRHLPCSISRIGGGS